MRTLSMLGTGNFRTAQHEMNYSRASRVIYDAAALGEDCEHSAVVAAYISLKSNDSASLSNSGEMPNQQQPNPGTLVIIKNRQRYFRP